MSSGRSRTAIAIGAALSFALFAAQLLQPIQPRAVLPGEGKLRDHVRVSESVHKLLRTACYDCHSNETRWPWYSRVAPVSWFIAQDVQQGRSNLDFSKWSTDPVVEPTPVQRLSWICRDIRQGLMPPRPYLFVHPDARLSEKEKNRICEWTEDALRHVSDTSLTSNAGPTLYPHMVRGAPPAAR